MLIHRIIFCFQILSCFTLLGQVSKTKDCGFLVIYEDTRTLGLLNIQKLKYQNDSILIWSLGRVENFSDSFTYKNFKQYNHSIDTFYVRNGDLWYNSFWGKLPFYSLEEFKACQTTYLYKINNNKFDSSLNIRRESLVPISIIQNNEKKLYLYEYWISTLNIKSKHIPRYEDLNEIPESVYDIDSSGIFITSGISFVLYDPGFGYNSMESSIGMSEKTIYKMIWESNCKSDLMEIFKSWD
jgi:hypothetical protein